MNSEEKLQVKKNVLSRMDMAVDIEDRDVKDIIDRCRVSSDAMRTMGLNEKLEFKKELFNSLRRLDILSELLEDDRQSFLLPLSISTPYIAATFPLEAMDLTTDNMRNTRLRLPNIYEIIVSVAVLSETALNLLLLIKISSSCFPRKIV